MYTYWVQVNIILFYFPRKPRADDCCSGYLLLCKVEFNALKTTPRTNIHFICLYFIAKNMDKI